MVTPAPKIKLIQSNVSGRYMCVTDRVTDAQKYSEIGSTLYIINCLPKTSGHIK